MNTDHANGMHVAFTKTRDDVTCKTCQLCQRSTRKDIIGFTVHGTQAKKANIIAMG